MVGQRMLWLCLARARIAACMQRPMQQFSTFVLVAIALSYSVAARSLLLHISISDSHAHLQSLNRIRHIISKHAPSPFQYAHASSHHQQQASFQMLRLNWFANRRRCQRCNNISHPTDDASKCSAASVPANACVVTSSATSFVSNAPSQLVCQPPPLSTLQQQQPPHR